MTQALIAVLGLVSVIGPALATRLSSGPRRDLALMREHRETRDSLQLGTEASQRMDEALEATIARYRDRSLLMNERRKTLLRIPPMIVMGALGLAGLANFLYNSEASDDTLWTYEDYLAILFLALVTVGFSRVITLVILLSAQEPGFSDGPGVLRTLKEHLRLRRELRGLEARDGEKKAEIARLTAQRDDLRKQLNLPES